MSDAPARGPFVVVFAGVGGQGTLSAARFLGFAADRAHVPVSVSQLHGMSQRGGSVQSTVFLGNHHVLPPEDGPVDVVVGLELLETLRQVSRIGPRTTVLGNRWMLPPPGVALSCARLPTIDQMVAETARRAGTAHFFDATALAERAGGRGTTNVVLLGALSRLPGLPVPADELRATIRDAVRPGAWPANQRAFELGREAAG